MLKQRGSSTKWKILRYLWSIAKLCFILLYLQCTPIMNLMNVTSLWIWEKEVPFIMFREQLRITSTQYTITLVLITLLKIRHSTKGGIPDTDSWKRSLSLTKQLNLHYFFFHKDDKPRKQPKISCISTTRTCSMVSKCPQNSPHILPLGKPLASSMALTGILLRKHFQINNWIFGMVSTF